MCKVLEQFSDSIDYRLARRIAAAAKGEKVVSTATNTSLTSIDIEERIAVPSNSVRKQMSPQSSVRKRSRVESLAENRLLTSFIGLLAITGLVVYYLQISLPILWLAVLGLVIIGAFILIRYSHRLQRFFNGLF